MKAIRKSRHAFTLIEIMVVVIVLGILAALVIPNVTGNTDDAKVARAQSDISSLMTAVEQYRLHMRRYPYEEEGLSVLREPPASSDANLWKGPYLMRPLPNDPWGEPYHYYQPAPNGIDGFGIESYGADRSPGGENYDTDVNSWTDYEQGEAAP